MTKPEPASPAFVYAFIAFLLMAPIIPAGVLPLPPMALTLAAVALLLAVAVAQRAPPRLPRAVLAAVLLLLVYPLVQLIPLPGAWGHALPGAAQASASISVDPAATLNGWLGLLPVLACLLAIGRMRPGDAAMVAALMVSLAALAALLGLVQVGQGDASPYYFKRAHAQGAAVGTFTSRDQLAAMFAMSLPVVVGLIVFSIRHERRMVRRRKRSERFDANLFAQRALLFAAGVVILLCLLFTHSRAGMATATIGLACSAFLLPRAHGGIKYTGYIVGGLAGLSLLLALTIGVTPIIERLQPGPVYAWMRGQHATNTTLLQAAIEFLPFGSGLATLPEALGRPMPIEPADPSNPLHNGYLQAFAELGLVAPVVIGLLLFAYGKRMLGLLREGSRASFTLLQLAAGVALLPPILHSLVDSSLHVPALAMWFATLAGLLFHPGADATRQSGQRARVRARVAAMRADQAPPP